MSLIEIKYDPATGRFTANGEWITDDHLWSIWNDGTPAFYSQDAHDQIRAMLKAREQWALNHF